MIWLMIGCFAFALCSLAFIFTPFIGYIKVRKAMKRQTDMAAKIKGACAHRISYYEQPV